MAEFERVRDLLNLTDPPRRIGNPGLWFVLGQQLPPRVVFALFEFVQLGLEAVL
jgi:hypothetical protein